MTEPTRPLPDAAPGDERGDERGGERGNGPNGGPGAAGTPPVNVTRLVAEAATKSGLLWIRLPQGATHPAWHVWHDDGDPRGTGPAAYVVSGMGEQPLPWLPEHVELIFRSKDTGGRLLTIPAQVIEVTPESPRWDAAVAVLLPERLNFGEDGEAVDARWRAGCTIHILTPHGQPTEQPGEYAAQSGAAVVTAATGTTAGWRPWHWFGRPATRRGTVGR